MTGLVLAVTTTPLLSQQGGLPLLVSCWTGRGVRGILVAWAGVWSQWTPFVQLEKPSRAQRKPDKRYCVLEGAHRIYSPRKIIALPDADTRNPTLSSAGCVRWTGCARLGGLRSVCGARSGVRGGRSVVRGARLGVAAPVRGSAGSAAPVRVCAAPVRGSVASVGYAAPIRWCAAARSVERGARSGVRGGRSVVRGRSGVVAAVRGCAAPGRGCAAPGRGCAVAGRGCAAAVREYYGTS
eukprot:gene25170-biopygen2974